ncbi:Sensor kinase CusS [Clostridioides difficile]|nr:Sensor kinase CusS [Clostridioides difficile]
MKKERKWENQKNNLITNLSHDLRTPLTSILGFLELIEKDTNNDEKLNHYCNISLEKAKNLKNSIDQLFEFTKIIVKFVNYGEEIKQKDIENMFNRFYRVEKSCNKKEGTGLGLAIVKTVIELHLGEINVASSKEETQFEIKIPINV